MHSLLQSDATPEAKIFAATTLKGKVRFFRGVDSSLYTKAILIDYL